MHFILKLFPEITLKSTPVRNRMTRQLVDNLRLLLKRQFGAGKVIQGGSAGDYPARRGMPVILGLPRSFWPALPVLPILPWCAVSSGGCAWHL